MRKIALFLSLVMLPIVLTAFDFTTDTFISKDDQLKVQGGKIVTRMYLKYNGAGENSDESIKVPLTEYTGAEFNDFEMITDEKTFFPFDLGKRSINELYKILTSPSQLQGSLYYSRRAEKVEELIVESFAINEAGSKIDDPKYSTITPVVKGRITQKDNKFGKLRYLSELYNSGNNFVLVTTCEDSIPLICNKNEYKIVSFFIYDEANKGYYYYAVYGMRIKTELFLKKGSIKTLSPTTFSNRLRAATVKLALLMGLDWSSKYNPWENDPMGRDRYK